MKKIVSDAEEQVTLQQAIGLRNFIGVKWKSGERSLLIQVGYEDWRLITSRSFTTSAIYSEVGMTHATTFSSPKSAESSARQQGAELFAFDDLDEAFTFMQG